VEAVGNSRRRRLVGPTPRLAPGCCAPDPLPAISPPGEFSGTAGSLDLYPQYPAVLRSYFTIFINYLIKGIHLSYKLYGFYFLICKRAAQNFPTCYGTHLCAWPAPCPKLAAIAPAAPFAHYYQLVAQPLSTTNLVFAKIESASEKIWQLLNKQRVESKRGRGRTDADLRFPRSYWWTGEWCLRNVFHWCLQCPPPKQPNPSVH